MQEPHRARRRLLAAFAAFGLLAGACGGDDKDAGGAGESGAAAGGGAAEGGGGGAAGGGAAGGAAAGGAESADQPEGPDTAASALRASLTDLLQAHVFLVGVATDQVLSGQDPAPAIGALDQNSVALADAFATFYPAARQPFLDLWRAHIGFFVDFTTATAANDKAATDRAKAGLDKYKTDFATLINTTNPQLATKLVAEDLSSHITGVLGAITAQAKKDPTGPLKIKDAAAHMRRTAAVLSAGIVKHLPDRVAGSADSPGATLRATLTAALQEHVYLAGITTATAFAGGDVKQAMKVLDDNTEGVVNIISSVYGDEDAGRFAPRWQAHVDMVVRFAEGLAAKDAAKAAKARADLSAYRSSFAAFMHSLNPKLAAAGVATQLGTHIDSLLAAVEAQSRDDPAQFTLLAQAAHHMEAMAEALAEAMAEQFESRFG